MKNVLEELEALAKKQEERMNSESTPGIYFYLKGLARGKYIAYLHAISLIKESMKK